MKEKVVRVAEQKNVLLEHLYHKPLINPDELYNELMEYKKMVEPYVANVSLFLHEALKEGKTILLEGTTGIYERPGSWNLSDGYIFLYPGRIWCNRCRNPAI